MIRELMNFLGGIGAGLAMAVAMALMPTCGCAEESAGANAALKSAISAGVRTFEPDRLLLSTEAEGKKVGSGFSLSPEVGISHTVREREQPGNVEGVTHKVHAQAGGRVSLYDRFYLGFATKLPIYNYEGTSGHSVAGVRDQDTRARHDYELLRLSPENLTVTGEVGYRIGQRLHLNIYYDQNRYKNPASTRGGMDEDVFGTRVIYRFK